MASFEKEYIIFRSFEQMVEMQPTHKDYKVLLEQVTKQVGKGDR